jgi:hypothetical protein
VPEAAGHGRLVSGLSSQFPQAQIRHLADGTVPPLRSR